MADEELGEFYVRYYVGHKGKFGHEFLEFEFRPDGKLRYANNSNYKNDTMIRKEVFLTQSALRECRRIIADSEVLRFLSLSLSLSFVYSLRYSSFGTIPASFFGKRTCIFPVLFFETLFFLHLLDGKKRVWIYSIYENASVCYTSG